MGRGVRALLILLGLAGGAGYLVGLALHAPTLRLLAKPLPVLCLAVGVAASGPDCYRRLITAGLLASVAGDVLLEMPARFLPGLLAFLVAHVLYIAAFVTDAPRLRLARALPFAAWVGLAYARLAPGLGDMRLPVAAYVAVIAIMMWRAAARVGHADPARLAKWSGLAGAVLFGLSDTLIAFDRFHAPIGGVRYPIILLYWLGQAGIAASSAPEVPPRRAPAFEFSGTSG
jgi:alkenylglycerophosphocholine hydrolase